MGFHTGSFGVNRSNPNLFSTPLTMVDPTSPHQRAMKERVMPDLAYLNGTIMPIEDAMVPIEDRGYQFGDGVYEYIASYQGRLFMLDAHLDRLEQSMDGMDFPPLDRAQFVDALEELFKRAGYPRAGIYVQITRGVAPRNHAYTKELRPQVVMTIRAINEMSADARSKGVAAMTVKDLRWQRCDVKTTQLVANSMAKQQALNKGFYDAIFVSGEGTVREGTSSNVFIVSNNRLLTHPLTRNILPGITRMVIIDICKETGMPVEETFFDTAMLYAADEVFLTGTVTEVLPVISIDDVAIGGGQAGPVTQRLYEALRERAKADLPA